MSESSPLVPSNPVAVLGLSTGVDYTSGDYGGDVDIQDVYIPTTATVGHDRLQLSALTGFTDSSPDFGGGALIKRTF